jgi:GH25 family lysozyme M1 (1,4-beta-N-acetylmuramidase)
MLELKTIADLISEKVPEFKTAWEEMTTTDNNGKLTFNLNKDEMVKSIGSVIDKLKEQYATEALEEQYKQLYSDKIKSNQDIALATQDVIDAQEGLKKAQDEYNEALQRQMDAGETFGPLADAVRDAEAGLDQYNENLQTAEAKLLAAKGKQEEFNTKLDSLGNTLDVVAGKYDANNKNLQALRDAYDNGFIDIETLKKNFNVSEEELFKGTKSMAEQSALGYQKGINGDMIVDPYFTKNIKAAKKEGLLVGVYIYTYASSKEDAIKQADWARKSLEDYEIDLGISYDWEEFRLFSKLNLSYYHFTEVANTFLDYLDKYNLAGMLYSSKYYLENIWTKTNHDVWLAHYTSKTTYKGKYKMWQLSSSGKIDGIKGAVDIDIMYN